jgi:hypothetical protein
MYEGWPIAGGAVSIRIVVVGRISEKRDARIQNRIGKDNRRDQAITGRAETGKRESSGVAASAGRIAVYEGRGRKKRDGRYYTGSWT